MAIADWELIGSSENGDTFYINHFTIKVDGTNITAWIATDYSSLNLLLDNMGYKSSKSQFEFHCARQMYTLKNVTLYSKSTQDKGQLILATDIPNKKPKTARANSLNDIILKELCQKYMATP